MILFIVSTSQRESMFAKLHSDINSHKSGLLHFTNLPNSPKGRGKVGNGIILAALLLWTLSVD
jgi:hypothetical protein